MKITLCTSATFNKNLLEFKLALEEHGHEIFLPSMHDYHHLEEGALAKIHHDLINDHFKKISQSNAIYVVNLEKNNIVGYIGGNTLLEMGLAFYHKIPIFLLNDIPKKVSYREEILAMQPIVIGKDWSRLNG